MDQDSDKEKVCDICGHAGVVDAIIDCTQCKVNHEHMYCAGVRVEELVEDWICGECEFSNKQLPETSPLLGQVSKSKPVEVGKSRPELPSESKKIQNESRLGSGNWEKRVETGKTKYISVNEAIMLTSGETSTQVNFKWCPKAKQPKIGTNAFKRSPIRRKSVPVRFSSRQAPASGSSQQSKLQRVGNVAICEKQLQQSTKPTEVPVNSPQPSQAPKNRDMQLPRNIQWAQTKARRVVEKQSSTQNLSPNTISGKSGVITHTTNEQKIMDASVLPDSEICSWAPALDVLWKGSFNIQEDKLNPHIRAHPPTRVRRKVYEFSRKLPDVLQFQLVSAQTSWLNVFNELIPDENDIALYFFPSAEGRWAEYIGLVESISMRDLALRVQIDDIELFVFTSKRLPVNSQCVDENYFLWGVFHRPEHATTNDRGRAQELPIQPSDGANHAHDEVDMEIDMAGGVDVGRVDIPVKRDMVGGVDVGRLDIRVKREPIEGTSPKVTFPMPPPSLDDPLLIPPGFEEVYKSRIQQLASLRKNV